MKKKLLILIPMLMLCGCGQTYSIPEGGKVITTKEAKDQLSSTFENMDKIDAYGIELKDADFLFTLKEISENKVVKNAKINIEKYGFKALFSGLTTAKDINGLLGQVDANVKGSFSFENAENTADNRNASVDAKVGTYLKDGKIYVDLSSKDAFDFVKKVTNTELKQNQFYVPLDGLDMKFPLLQEGTLEGMLDSISSIGQGENDLIKFDKKYIDKFTELFVTCKSYNNEWGIALEINKDNLIEFYRYIITSSNEGVQDTLVDQATEEMKKSLEKSGFNYIKGGLIYNQKYVKTIFTDVDFGLEINGGDKVTTNIYLKEKFSFNFLYGKDVKIEIPSLDNYKLLEK